MQSKLHSTLRSALLCTLSLLASATFAQTTINVGPGQPYTTIQSGINAANNGDTVLVAPGTYNENIDFKGKAITVTSSGGATATIIDGGNKPGVATVIFAHGETSASVISGFTIRGGGDTIFGGTSDGGVYAGGASPVIQGNTITANYCYDIDVQFGTALILNNEISGVLQSHGRTGPVSYCTFGSGIHLGGTPNFLTGLGSIIIGNTIENNLTGSAINIWAAQNVLIMNNIIRNNTSPDPGSAFTSANSEGTVIAQNLIYRNVSSCGGALQFENAGSASNPVVLVTNNTIVDNTMSPTLEGITNCIYIAQIYPAAYSYGESGPGVVIANNIISGSTPYPSVNCSWFQPPSESIQPTFENNILYNAGGPFFGSYCIDVSGKYNNISADPQFVNPSTGDYHLKRTSPAIDSGQNGVLQNFRTMTGLDFSKDFEGKARVQDATGKGCIIDMGAYEYPGSVSDCGVYVSETLTSSLNPAMAGQSVTFAARLSATSGTPTGTIQFLDGTNLLSTQTVSSAGSTSFTTSSLTVGSHTISANYEPTGSFDPSTASLVQVIDGNPTSTALTCLPNAIDIGKTAQLSVIVTSASGTPTGSISFTDNGTTFAASGLVGGKASLTYAGSVPGTHTISAAYVPTGSFAASSASCTEIVNTLPTTSTLTVTPVTASYNSSITLAATVSPATLPAPSTPTGIVTFYSGASAIGTGALTGGVATLAVATLPGGNYNLSCMYGGSSIYSASDCNPVQVLITAAPTSVSVSGSPNPGDLNQPITFTAAVSSPAAAVSNGSVTFYDGPTLLGTSPVSAAGSASLTTAFTVVGTHNITAVYGGSADFLASTSAVFKETILAGDFAINVLPGAATVYTGEAAAVKVSITSLQGFNQPLAFSCSGLPANATCTFNSATLPEGQGAAKLVIQTAAPHSQAAPSAAALGALALLLLPGWRRRRRFLTGACVLLLIVGSGTAMSGCGAVSPITGGTPPGTYRVAVTATTEGSGTTLEHSAVVTLTVKSLF